MVEPWIEEVALLYATGRDEEVLATLDRQISGDSSSNDTTPWLMLFDIHEARGRKDLFEELALKYALRFERSPPAWAPLATQTARGVGDPILYTFGPQLTGVDKARMQHFLREAASASHVRLDFSHAPAPPPPYARAMLDCIQQLRKLDKAIEPVGGPAFIVRLNSVCTTERADQSDWLLLLAIEELLGDRNGFETIALSYAVRYEMSPPSYTPPKPLPSVASVADPMPASPDTYLLDGSIGQKAASQLEGLVDFSVGRSMVEVDMARVARIDFAATGQFLDILIRLKSRGCQPVLTHCNSLVMALLLLIGADQHANILPRKRA
jgi:anti-anti-sigma regulatory factor